MGIWRLFCMRRTNLLPRTNFYKYLSNECCSSAIASHQKDCEYENVENHSHISRKWATPPVFCESNFVRFLRPLPTESGALLVQLTLAHIGPRSTGGDEFNALTKIYLERASAFVPCEAISF